MLALWTAQDLIVVVASTKWTGGQERNRIHTRNPTLQV